MDRELLLELGCEELPAGWLPNLTRQIGEVVEAGLREHRLEPAAPVETFSTPRRLTVRIARVAERQTDLEDLVTGPPVSAAFKPDGTPTPAATGFAAKQGVDVGALEQIDTPKGRYLACRRHQRGRAAVDILPHVLAAVLRGLSFPKQMHWDARLDDGRGDLLVGRPIRWVLFLYGGRVVPFTIARTELAQGPRVQEVRSGAVTYGHRFLTTSGRAGRAIKVKTFEDYRRKLLENFVVLDRNDRHDKIARELDAKALRLHGRVSTATVGDSTLLHEVPDLVEYPAVVAGVFAPEFLELPEEVLTTTMVHHQHFFPIVNEDGRLMPAFLAVVNTEPEDERTIARNAERVLTARLRDAKFFWDADRRIPLAARIDRLSTVQFHKRLGSYREKAERIAALAAAVASGPLGVDVVTATRAAEAARLAKADLTTDMVREFTELQGVMGGVYAREEGQPEAVWRAIYHQYLPLGVEVDAPPTRAQLGEAAVTWAALSIADKLDTIVGLLAAGEKVSGTRDPFGLRRQAQGIVKILIDLPELTGLDVSPDVARLLDEAWKPLGAVPGLDRAAWETQALAFFGERLQHVLERRGFAYDECRAVLAGSGGGLRPLDVRRKVEALAQARRSAEFEALAVLFKRVKNIAKELPAGAASAETFGALRPQLREPAELDLLAEIERRQPAVRQAMDRRRYPDALAELAGLRPAVDRFFVEVLVMVDEEALRRARLTLLGQLRDLVLDIAD
ncbi:MAG: glycine--tRNA ligase subunit beta, partial [Acidobacteriota bacterium]|nr:glycine--tRNA ligase subunit beta [Acidobacteriota bacterium]